MTYNKKREMLIDYNICTEDALELVEYINGANDGTINDIVYVRTGYVDFDQWYEDMVV